MIEELLPMEATQDTGSESRRKMTVDESGRLIIPPDIAGELGLKPGVAVPFELEGDTLRLRRPVTSLARVYVEPTSRCNLDCRTCIRNAWDEPLGDMSENTFQNVLEGLRGFDPIPLVFFGGFGEPLAHPQIGEMVARAKRIGARVELITNGIMLADKRSRQLVDAGLDRLWVSLDGATPESYADVRLAEALPKILENMAHFRNLTFANEGPRTELGVAFVAMKRNIADLSALLRLSYQIGVSQYMVTNLLPYTADMCNETLYALTLGKESLRYSYLSPQINLPRIDWNNATRLPLSNLMRTYENITFEGERLNRSANSCPFIARGATVIAWDGMVSPCLALMHSYSSYIDERKRYSLRYTLGNIHQRSLKEIWEDPNYLGFRQRVQEFDFSPCTCCGGCDLSERNEEDCFGNTFPTCGGCLWAQGVIQCP
jgi:MoaA/NifB/PqqE/SkfB family radical SAM enzyme